MTHSLDTELVEILDAVAPPLLVLDQLDLDQLDRLVLEDDRADAFDGECTEHDSCRPIFVKRLP